MKDKRPPKDAPANAGARPTVEQKRAQAAKRRAELAEYHAQHGKGTDVLYRFIDAFDAFESYRKDDDGGYKLDELLDQSKRVAKAFTRYLEHEVTTLEEAFDVRRPKRYRRAEARKRFERMISLVIDGRTLRHHGAKVDVALFELLAKMHGVGKDKATEWYYERNKGIKPQVGKSREDLPRRFAPYIHELEWDPLFLTSAGKTGITSSD